MLLAALAALALTRFRETPPAAAPVAFALEPPEGTTFTNIFGAYAPSPDGRYIVFGAGDARPSLWLRPVDSTSAREKLADRSLAGPRNAHQNDDHCSPLTACPPNMLRIIASSLDA